MGMFLLGHSLVWVSVLLEWLCVGNAVRNKSTF